MRTPDDQDASAVVVEEREDGSLVVEADTPEAALALARMQLGRDIHVREATRRERGGVKGFFAREYYRVEAEPAPGAAPPRRVVAPVPAMPTGRPEVDDLVRRIDAAAQSAVTADEAADDGVGRALGEVDAVEEEFGALLRRELDARGLRSWSEPAADAGGAARPASDPRPEPASPSPASTQARAEAGPAIDLRELPAPPVGGAPGRRDPVPVGPAAGGRPPVTLPARRPAVVPAPRVQPAPAREEQRIPVRSEPPSIGAVPAPAPASEVRWSVDRLAHLGLPFSVVQRTVGLDPADDLGWVSTLTDALTPFVATGDQPTVFVGPRADRIGAGLGIPGVVPPDLPPYAGSVALQSVDDGAGRAWLGRVRGDRAVHVVIGGRGWELFRTKQPDGVVFVGGERVVTALQVAVEDGVPISHLTDGPVVRRATPLDLAIAVRSLVGRR